MAFNFTCPHCSHPSQADETTAGRTIFCTACGKKITMPAILGGGMSGPPAKSNTSWIVILCVALPVLLIVVVGILTALLLPAVQAAREAARRNASVSNLKMIGVGMHNHADVRRSFPAAAIRSKEGTPLLSWRVSILPYIDEGDLYNEFHLEEPWDSEHNLKLIPRMPAFYASPGSTLAGQYKTNYLLPIGEGTIFASGKAPRFAEITDGTSKTIMVVEADDDLAVIWTKPDDLPYDPARPLQGLGGLRRAGFMAAFADAHVEMISDDVDPMILSSLFTGQGGEPSPGGF